MQTNKCKCGSKKIVYVVKRGRNNKLEAFCENCLPVEITEEENDISKPLSKIHEKATK